jgi:penicillin-insensitive murein DD-endopeptidase
MPKRTIAKGAAVSAAMLAFAAVAHAEVPPSPAPKPKPLKDRVQHLAPVPAKELFKAVKRAAAMPPAVYGFYTHGCLAGAEQLASDGPTWQAMRLSRNRRWGHPVTIALIKRLANDAKKYDGWPGLLVGDIAMPRGGPMPPAHASHQVGLDIDIWLTPMPDHLLPSSEREKMSATFMLTKNQLAVNSKVWTAAHARLIKRAASYREVQRVLVHPAIKKELCRTAGRDRAWLAKVRPVRGHNYHFHVRLRCPPGSPGCKSQTPPRHSDGCGKELKHWYRWLHARLKPKPKRKKPPHKAKPSPPMTMAALPRECRRVLAADDKPPAAAGKQAQRPTAASQ